MDRRRCAGLAVERLEGRHLFASAGGLAPPVNLAAVPVSASEIGLSWELVGGGDTSVVVERRTGATGGFATLAVLPAGETIFTDTSCWAGQSYGYRVKVGGPTGDSGYSSETAATAPGVESGGYETIAGLSAVAVSPTTVDVSFTDTNDGQASYLLERSADGVAYAVVASLGSATRWQDTGREPGTAVSYRVRAVGWSRPTSDYSAAVRLVLPQRLAGAPREPSAVAAVALSATSVEVTWAAGDAPWPPSWRFAVERSVGYDPWHPITWTRVATTAPGATSFIDVGLTAETPYAYRVLAIQDGLESDPGRPASDVMQAIFGGGVGVVTASAGTGGPRTYDIGPGRPLSRLADLDWSRLGPGDTVNVHHKPGGYHELLQIAGRGTASAWITVNGVPDPATGSLPVIDGQDAVLAPKFRNHYEPLHGSGAIVVGAPPGYTPGYKPGYITIQNLDIRNCYSASSFTDVDGTKRSYGDVGAGIYLERCDHVTIASCKIHDNGEGIFGAGQSGFDRLMTDITVDGNHIWGNGNVGREREHNTYLEAIDTVYQFNRYGPLRAGALGAGLKDRSVGTVIRFNWIEGGLHQLQLPEAQNQADLAMALPRYHRMIVEGNTLVAPPGVGASLIWVGGDQGLTPWYRKGVVRVFHNTLVARSDRSQVWKIIAIEAASGAEAIDARNNVLAAFPATVGGVRPEFGLVGRDNRVALGRNWVTPGWVPTTYGDGTFTGRITGAANLVGGPANDPGFVDAAAGDYRLAAGSPCIDGAGGLPASLAAYPVTSQFKSPHGAAARPVV
ncbi:MAG: right-handed parallel beta-helix repeat-containing protein, partial [Planctomycetia bacterium]